VLLRTKASPRAPPRSWRIAALRRAKTFERAHAGAWCACQLRFAAAARLRTQRRHCALSPQLAPLNRQPPLDALAFALPRRVRRVCPSLAARRRAPAPRHAARRAAMFAMNDRRSAARLALRQRRVWRR
jgi:hypothetical protein